MRNAFLRPPDVTADCVHVFQILLQRSLVSCVSARHNAEAINYESCNDDVINRQVQLFIQIGKDPHFFIPPTFTPRISSFCNHTQSQCSVTEQISCHVEQNIQKLKKTFFFFKAKGIVKAFPTPILHS